MKEDSRSIDDFVALDFSFQVDSDNDDDASMNEGDNHKLNQKLDDILYLTSAFMTMKCEELISSHQ